MTSVQPTPPPSHSDGGIKRELDPIVRHGVVIIFLAFVSAAFAFVAEIIKAFLPRMKGSLELFENIDGVTVLTLVTIFGTYTVLVVVARLLHSLRNEVSLLFTHPAAKKNLL